MKRDPRWVVLMVLHFETAELTRLHSPDTRFEVALFVRIRLLRYAEGIIFQSPGEAKASETSVGAALGHLVLPLRGGLDAIVFSS